MSAIIIFPNFKKRTPKRPFELVPSSKILRTWNSRMSNKTSRVMTDEIYQWFIEKALRKGWDSAVRMGNGVLLGKKF